MKYIEAPAIAEIEKPPLVLSQLVFLRFKRHKMAVAGIFILAFMIVYAIAGTFFKTEAYSLVTDTGIRLNAPSSVHPFGTDAVGAATVVSPVIRLMVTSWPARSVPYRKV